MNLERVKLGALLISFLILFAGKTIILPEPADATTIIKISHQWAGGTIEKGEYRDRLCRTFAKKVEERTKGALKFEIYPSSMLFKPVPQYDALLKGALDISLIPLDYAGGKVPQYSITHMPCLMKDYHHGQHWSNSDFGKAIDRLCEENGVKVLTWTYSRGGIGSRMRPIKLPADVKGLKIRAAGKMFDTMLYKAGASITSMPSSEIYFALQTGVLDAALTSNSSFESYRLYEQIQYYTSTRHASIFHMFVPLLMSTVTFKKLSPEHQKVVMEVGKEMEKFAVEEGTKADEEATLLFEQKGVKVYDMTTDDYKAWLEVSEKSAWKDFAEKVKGGKELLDMALAVK